MLINLKNISYDEFSKLVVTTHFESTAYGLVHEFAFHAIEEMLVESPVLKYFNWDGNEYVLNKNTIDNPKDHEAIIEAIDTALGNHDINDLILGDLMDHVSKAIDSYRKENSPKIKKLKFDVAISSFVSAINIIRYEYEIDNVAKLNMETLYHEFTELINWIYEYQNDSYIVDTESGVVYKSLDEY